VRGDEQRGEGLGLGLSLVQRICGNQHWTVTLSSRVQGGCRFCVELQPAIDCLSPMTTCAANLR
jgi:signal transduction histidine kinase